MCLGLCIVFIHCTLTYWVWWGYGILSSGTYFKGKLFMFCLASVCLFVCFCGFWSNSCTGSSLSQALSWWGRKSGQVRKKDRDWGRERRACVLPSPLCLPLFPAFLCLPLLIKSLEQTTGPFDSYHDNHPRIEWQHPFNNSCVKFKIKSVKFSVISL